MRRLILIVALASCLTNASVARAGGSRPAEPSPPTGPQLKLTVTPRHGFRPLTINLTGVLSGVERNDEQYCHAGVEWELRSPMGASLTSRQDPKCLHPPEQIEVQTLFTKVVTLSEPGVYVYRLILYRRDGERLYSNTQEIRVLDNL